MNKSTDIISRMEAMQQRFGRLQLCSTSSLRDNTEAQLDSIEKTCNVPEYLCRERKLIEVEWLGIERPESERQILRCTPPFDAQAEHEADLRYESRVDYESWQYDGPEEMEDV